MDSGVSDFFSRYRKLLLERGVPRRVVEELFSGTRVCGEDYPWIMLEAARDLGAETLAEDEEDVLGGEPSYYIIVSLGRSHTLVYMHSGERKCVWISTRRRISRDKSFLEKMTGIS